MRTHVALLVLCAAGLATAAPQQDKKASPREYRLQWRDLDRMIRGREVAFALPSGIKLRGDVVAVEAEELVMDVRKTSDKMAYPKGRATVPRPEIQRLRMWTKRSYTWRAVGTAIGAAAGTLIAIPIGMYMNNEGGEAAGAVALAVGIPATLGYIAGWGTDRSSVTIVIDPGPAPAPSGPPE